MSNVRLKAKEPFSFKDTIRIINEYGNAEYIRKEFVFNLDNNCTCEVPKKTWERLEHEYIQKGRKGNLMYKEFLIEL